jgi:DNA-binding NarL/FixJ family response regulator
MSKIRVLLVDDHTVVRQGLRRILETDDEIEIVGEAGDGRSAVDMAQRMHPNIVVMDIALPELNGIEATRQIMKRNEGAKVLKAVKAIGRGGSFFSPAVSKVLLEGYLGDSGGQDVDDNLALLTDREREVLQLIAEGKTNKEIATVLSVSINTVETHRKHIMEKLDLHNTAEIVRFAVRKKIVH